MTTHSKPATPLPWIDPRTLAASYSIWQGDPQGKQVQVAACRVVNMDGETVPYMVDHDGDCAKNAAYIVHACNAYPELVAALRQAALLIGNVDHSTGHGPNAAAMRGEMLNGLRDIFSALLAKLGEGA